MTIAEFRRVFAALPQGWLDLEEALLLIDAAERTKGPVLEIGSYYGRSAVLLGNLREEDRSEPLVSKERWVGRRLTCVDPWADRGDFKYGPGVTGDEVHAAFRANVAALPNVTWVRGCVEDYVPAPVGFVYCDGDHTYDGTWAQLEKAIACNPQVIAVHDVNDSGGGREIKRACLELLGPWQERVNRLAVWEIR